jgi:hypothetical protein
MQKLFEPEKPAVTLHGTVEKIIPENSASPEKAQVSVDGAEQLYREIRMDNTLQDGDGKKMGLKEGSRVEVTIEAEADATIPKR